MAEIIAAVEYRCDYCGRSENGVEYMVVGLGQSAICDECVNVCREEIDERKAAKAGEKE